MDSHDRRARQGNVSSFASGPATGHADASLVQHVADVPPSAQFPGVTNDRYQVRGSISAGDPTGRSANMPSYPYQGSPQYGDLAAGQSIQASSLQFPQAATGDYSATADSSQRSQQQATQHQAPHTPQQSTQHQSPQQHTPQQYHNIYSQQTPPSTPYDPVQQYPPRQSAAIEVLSNQFAGVPQAYYVAGESGPTSAPGSGLAAQGVQQQYNPYGANQSPVARDSLTASYGAGIPDAIPSGTSAVQQGYNPQGGYAAPSNNIDSALAQYDEALRHVYSLVRNDDLAEAGVAIIGLSEWLLGNAENLGKKVASCYDSTKSKAKVAIGLVRDDESAHGTRLKLWNDFNTSWLALLQRQKDLSTGLGDALRRPGQPQRLLQYQQMEDMGKELIRLCDNMEKHGLVDYQMGVWEEDIISLLTSCLDLQEGKQRPASTTVSPSASRKR